MLPAEQQAKRRRGSPEADGRAAADKRRQRRQHSPVAARRYAADTSAPTSSRCRAAATDAGRPGPSRGRSAAADTSAPSTSQSRAAEGTRPPSAGKSRAAADASTPSASKSRAAALQRGALEPSGEWCFAPPLQRGPSKLQAALWWHLPGYAEVTGAVQLHVMWTGLVGSAWGRGEPALHCSFGLLDGGAAVGVHPPTTIRCQWLNGSDLQQSSGRCKSCSSHVQPSWRVGKLLQTPDSSSCLRVLCKCSISTLVASTCCCGQACSPKQAVLPVWPVPVDNTMSHEAHQRDVLRAQVDESCAGGPQQANPDVQLCLMLP